MIPPKSMLMNHRIMVTTLLTAGRYISECNELLFEPEFL